MKTLILILIVFGLGAVAQADTESCRTEIGLVGAEALSTQCVANGGQNCEISQPCSEIIYYLCYSLVEDDQELFACGANYYHSYVFGQTAHERCDKFAGGDEMAYFACRVNLDNGKPIK